MHGGCQSGTTWSSGQETIRGTSTKLQRGHTNENETTTKTTKIKEIHDMTSNATFACLVPDGVLACLVESMPSTVVLLYSPAWESFRPTTHASNRAMTMRGVIQAASDVCSKGLQHKSCMGNMMKAIDPLGSKCVSSKVCHPQSFSSIALPGRTQGLYGQSHEIHRSLRIQVRTHDFSFHRIRFHKEYAMQCLLVMH